MNVSLAFLTQSYFKTPKDIRLNCTHYYLMKIGNKAELRAIADRHSTDVPYKDFIKIYNRCTSQPYSFMTVDTTFHMIIVLDLGKILMIVIINKSFQENVDKLFKSQ